MIKSSGVPLNLWKEAVKHATWLKNCTSTRALPGSKTPLEVLTGEKPDLSGVPEFGQKVWVHDAKNYKLEARARVGRWMGYDVESSGSRIYWEEIWSITVERSVAFEKEIKIVVGDGMENEGEEGKDISPSNSPNSQQPSAPTTSTPSSLQPGTTLTMSNLPETVQPPSTSFLGPNFQSDTTSSRAKRVRNPSEKVKMLISGAATYTNRQNASKMPPGVQASAPSTSTSKDNIPPSDDDRTEFAGAAYIRDNLQPDYETAMQGEDKKRWKEATDKEYQTLIENSTWELTERPPKGTNVVDCKWAL